MPHGRSEDWVLLEFRDKLQDTAGDASADRNQMWSDFRKKVEKSLALQSVACGYGYGSRYLGLPGVADGWYVNHR